jgi:hypothetical protein
MGIKNGSVEITYPRDAVKQYLNYGSMYDPGLEQHSAVSTQPNPNLKTFNTEEKSKRRNFGKVWSLRIR